MPHACRPWPGPPSGGRAVLQPQQPAAYTAGAAGHHGLSSPKKTIFSCGLKPHLGLHSAPSHGAQSGQHTTQLVCGHTHLPTGGCGLGHTTGGAARPKLVQVAPAAATPAWAAAVSCPSGLREVPQPPPKAVRCMYVCFLVGPSAEPHVSGALRETMPKAYLYIHS